jgi:hypothetical protein
MRRKKETNIVEGRVKVGIGELGLDDGPEPEHRQVVSDDSVLPDPQVRRPPNSPVPEAIIDPKSPPLENAPELSYGRIAHSIESR